MPPGTHLAIFMPDFKMESQWSTLHPSCTVVVPTRPGIVGGRRALSRGRTDDAIDYTRRRRHEQSTIKGAVYIAVYSSNTDYTLSNRYRSGSSIELRSSVPIAKLLSAEEKVRRPSQKPSGMLSATAGDIIKVPWQAAIGVFAIWNQSHMLMRSASSARMQYASSRVRQSFPVNGRKPFQSQNADKPSYYAP